MSITENQDEAPLKNLDIGEGHGMGTFTYTSIGVVIDHMLKKMSATEIEHFFDKQGVPREVVELARCPSGKLACLRKIFTYLQTEDRGDIIQKVMEDVLAELWGPERTILEKDLLADNFTIIDGMVQAGPVDVEKERTALEVLIERTPSLSKDVLLHHLGDNQDLYTKGKWDASIGQARNLIEQLLRDIATGLAHRTGETPDFSRPVTVREYLVTCGFLEEDERKRLVDGVYGYLSEQGSHPGISQQRVARISRILCLEIAQYLIEKFLTLV